MLRNTIAAITCLVLYFMVNADALTAQESGAPLKPSDASTESDALQSSGETVQNVAVEIARDRAKLMHRIYSSTLTVMHDRYFHGDRTVVPARAMEDVFRDMEHETNTKARWISASLKAMSLDHEPESDFEKLAAKQIAAGKPYVEVLENGVYRRAAPIPLGSNCISCHAGFFREPPRKPKFAALVISIPVPPATVMDQ